jgi:hypothetical protein
VSSLAAIQPFTAWAPYCTIKAARDMLFRAAAGENPVPELRAQEKNTEKKLAVSVGVVRFFFFFFFFWCHGFFF